MPVYEYKCRECGKVSEYRMTTQTESKPLSCTSCGSLKLERLISIPNISTGRSNPPGHTCCGRTERCEKPPCSDGGYCGRH